MNIIICYESYNSMKIQYALFQLVIFLTCMLMTSQRLTKLRMEMLPIFGTGSIFSSIIVLLI